MSKKCLHRNLSVREREARFISQTSRTSPSLSEHPYASIAALARLRSRAALAKRLAFGRYKFQSEKLRKFNRKPSQISFKILPKSLQIHSKPSQNPPHIHPEPLPNPPSKIPSKTFLNFIQNPPKVIPKSFKTLPKSSPNPPRTVPKPSPGGLLGGGSEMFTKFLRFGLHLGSPEPPFWINFS